MLKAEAGPGVGGGHVMRCLAIAEALAMRGARVAFATSPASLEAVPRLAQSGLEIMGPEPRACGAVLLDGYGFTPDDERAWAKAGAGVAVMEDLPGRRHACALMITPTPDESGAYAAGAPAGARVLAGPDFAPVDAGFTALREAAVARRRPSPPRHILVSPGLTDPGGGALKALAALQLVSGVERITVATGAAALSAMALKAAAAADPRVRLAFDAPDMARLTLEADLAIGAAGVSTWERCVLGLPSLVMVAADNQVPNARALASAGAATIIGPVEAIAPGFLRALLQALAAQPERLGRMSAAAFALCDGNGSGRIAEALLSLSGADQA